MRLLAHVTTGVLLMFAASACTERPMPIAPQSNKEFTEVNPKDPYQEIRLPINLGPDDFVDITAGASHTCARKMNNTVYCWGRNDHGQAGSSVSQRCVGSINCVDSPRKVTAQYADFLARTIDAGSNHTCALGLKTDAYCWGDGDEGQAGTGPYYTSVGSEVLPVFGGLEFSSISAGSNSTCGTTSSGMHCWGSLMNRAPTPQLVSKFNAYNTVTVGADHACTLWPAGSIVQVHCWGLNRFGQLGMAIQGGDVEFANTSDFSDRAIRVTTEASFTCVEQQTGTVECAGLNQFGQLGNGQSGAYTSTGTPQTVGGGMPLYGVTTGSSHTCALSGPGDAFCWGSGSSGKLGNGGVANVSTPTPVAGGLTYRAIAAGGEHTCAIGTDNIIYCWGGNRYGQLGIQGSSAELTQWEPTKTLPREGK